MEEKLLNLAYELADEIKKSSSFLKLKELKSEIKKDDYLNSLITNFNKIKLKYADVSQYSTYHPDYSKVKKQLVDSKKEVFLNETIKEYKNLEKEIQQLLDKVSRDIAQSVSFKIKHPNEIGFIKK
ncbi:MAG: YlbF family regulator [Candidatus Izemoplasma sp.]